MGRVKVDLLVIGNLLVNSMLTGGGKTYDYICYADEKQYEADKVIHGDHEIDGCGNMSVAATGSVTVIRKEV